MKTLIVYYSYEGSCAAVAEKLKAALNGDSLEIKTAVQKKRKGASKYFWGGLQVMMNKKPALAPYEIDPGKWDLIIIGTPVWASSPAPAIVSFLDKEKLSGKKIALFCCHAGGPGGVMEKFRALLPGNTIAGTIDFKEASKEDPAELTKKISEWVKTLGV